MKSANSKNSKRPVYLDYAATTPVDPRVFAAMEPYFSNTFGNPGSLHSFGQSAIAAIDRSRDAIAASIGATFREVVFTSSATEANNLALRGILKKSKIQNPRIIVSAIEHESILEVARDLERAGVEVIYLPVDEQGKVKLDDLKESLNERTVLVSIMYANNEVGTIQPIAEAAKIIKDFRTQKTASSPSVPTLYPLFHTDASQAFQFLDCDVEALGVDLMTISSHKVYGPKGAGTLYIKNKRSNGQFTNIEGIVIGGGQEFGLRSGTENVPAIVGFAKAAELAVAMRNKEAKRLAALRTKLWQGIKKNYKHAEVNGIEKINIATPLALPNVLNVYLPGIPAQDFLTKADLTGLAVSSGSACRSRAMESSYVITALGFSEARAKSSIRFSLGRPTAAAEIAKALKTLAKILKV